MMTSIVFSAYLESKQNDIFEQGQAYIAADNSVTFTSDFVPLLKLGTIVAITRVLGDKQFERFVGKVYLSSRKLLRIVDVENSLIDEALKTFESNVILPGDFYMAPSASTRLNLQKAVGISGFLRYISADVVKICTMEYVEPEQYLMFNINESQLSLEKMMVRVKDRVLLMRSAALLLCEPVALSENNDAAIKNYLRQLEVEQLYDNI